MKQIDVYQTNSNNIYTYATKANELAQSPGTFNIPYGAKLTPPPAIPDGMAALAAGESWILVEDHRTEVFYRVDTDDKYEFDTAIVVDNVAVIYAGVGAVPLWLTNVAPPPAPEVEQPAA